jgi:hypothetical protein
LAVYRELSAEAAAVMDQSHPTPTQEENDAAMMGTAHPDEQAADHGRPVMPPLHEQYARLAAAAEPKPRAGPPTAHHAGPAPRPPAASAAPDKK